MKKKLTKRQLIRAGEILRAADKYVVKNYGKDCYLYTSNVMDFLNGAMFILKTYRVGGKVNGKKK